MLSPDQQKAKDMVLDWFENASYKDAPIFKLFGYAGTGKTTTIKSIIEEISAHKRIAFGAYTGKAALVMRKQGLPARTLHSLMYKVILPDEVVLKNLVKQIESASGEKKKELQNELRESSKVSFSLNDESELYDTDLLVLDECSMVNDEMLHDLLSFEVPLLVLGDPGQLPPIAGTGALTRGKADVTLIQIHRQSEDSPIIDFATRARQGITLPHCEKGSAKNVKSVSLDELLSVDQVITGTNNTRRALNRLLRPGVKTYPEVGEKLICLKNDRTASLFNGLMAEVVEVGELLDSTIELVIQPELENSSPQKVEALRAYFEEYNTPGSVENIRWWERRNAQEFDFGYAITVHKSQGSQWDKVALFDDNFLIWDRKQRSRWLYTAITRAAEEITITKSLQVVPDSELLDEYIAQD